MLENELKTGGIENVEFITKSFTSYICRFFSIGIFPRGKCAIVWSWRKIVPNAPNSSEFGCFEQVDNSGGIFVKLSPPISMGKSPKWLDTPRMTRHSRVVASWRARTPGLGLDGLHGGAVQELLVLRLPPLGCRLRLHRLSAGPIRDVNPEQEAVVHDLETLQHLKRLARYFICDIFPLLVQR